MRIGSTDVKVGYIEDKNKEIILLCGLPNCGKSTYIRNNNLDKSHTIISRDSILLELADTNDYQEAWVKVDHKKVDLLLEEKFIGAVNRKEDIIIDMTNVSSKSRNKFINRVPKKLYSKKCIIFATELSEIKRRNIERSKKDNKFIPEEVILKMMKSFTLPLIGDGFDHVMWEF